MKKEKLIPHAKALSLLLKNVPFAGIENILLSEAAGRVLRADVKSDRPLPPFDRSAMDGYAIKYSDISKGTKLFKCVGRLEAGASYDRKVKGGEALKIMTGAPVPDGADMVVKVEHSKASGNMVELVETKPEKWLNVHRFGSDTKKGSVVLREGTLLGPMNMSVAASVGAVQMKVSKRIRIMVVTTGNEIIPPSANPKSAQVRDSNSSFLRGSLSQLNLVKADFKGPLRDNPKLLESAFRNGIDKYDVLIITGGVSMGDSDHTHSLLKKIGVKKLFHRLAIRPGKPVWFGMKGKKVVFGLPGNPVSVSATFHEFVLPAIRKMSGMKDVLPFSVRLPLSVDVNKKNNLKEFRVGNVSTDGASVAPVKSYKGSGDFISASAGNGLIVFPEESRLFKAGEILEFHPWRV